MTPLQKSIAEIEAMIDSIQQGVDRFNTGTSEINKIDIVTSYLLSAIEILTANLEYEREELKNAYNQGHFDGNDGCEMDFNDYYTKTYEHEANRS